MSVGYIIIVYASFITTINCLYANNSRLKYGKIELTEDEFNEEGIWGPLLEEWATRKTQRGRVMMLPQTEVPYIISERNATVEEPKESKISPGKITNSPPIKQVTETDLYLLGAIEKLVYRVDYMEKRLRKVEEMLYYAIAGNRVDHDPPCPENFNRVGGSCYFIRSTAGREVDWKVANKYCRKNNAILSELKNAKEFYDIVSYIQNNKSLKGKDFWVGGLNPGLLWIWSNSARPVVTQQNTTIIGDGRCLKLAYNPALRNYFYRGTDCASRHSFICEQAENIEDNQISRLNKKLSN